ncbi:MAG: GNAT family N-acetyltransferase [Bacteroidales bacterium]
MITFHHATADDISLIRQLASQTWAHTYQNILSPDQLDWMFEWMYSPESLLRQMEQENQQFFIAFLGSEPCGYLSVEQQKEHLFHFQKIYVLPRFHGCGVGKSLIEKGIDYIRSVVSPPFQVELNVNRQNKAVRFYERIGFQVVDQGDFPVGNGYFMNDYIMSLTINE